MQRVMKSIKWLLYACLCPALSAVEPQVCLVAPDPARSFGAWEGWGTSLAWMGKIYGERDDVADLLFTTGQAVLDGEALPGLGMTIARYNLGASAWVPSAGRNMVVSKTILPFRQIEGFWRDSASADPASSSWDWSVDAAQRAMLHKAQVRGANRFELFANAPMWWMCANGNPSGAAKGRDENLPPANYQAFVTYLATVAKRARTTWGISFTSVAPFNEPISDNWFADCKQEGCHVGTAAQSTILPLLRAELDRQGLRDLPIAASDESFYDQALMTWRALTPAARECVARLNVHGYQLAKGQRSELYRQVAGAAGMPIWNSEHGDRFADGLEMARNLHRDFAELHPLAWCYWQPLDGGNQSGWGMIQADLTQGTIGKANPKYFVFAQYSRHIRPGMTIIDAAARNTVTAYDATAHRLVIVQLNDGPSCDLRCDLSRFTVADGPVARFLTEPLGQTRYADLAPVMLSQLRFSAVCPAKSVQTFVVEGAVPR